MSVGKCSGMCVLTHTDRMHKIEDIMLQQDDVQRVSVHSPIHYGANEREHDHSCGEHLCAPMGKYGRFPLPGPSDIPSSSTNKRRNGTEGSMLSEY
jgi:hypothetical protein